MNNVVIKTIKKIGIIILVCLIIPIFCLLLPKNDIIQMSLQNMVAENNKNILYNFKGETINCNETKDKCLSTETKGTKNNEVIASFSTDISTSSDARKHNVKLALSSLNNIVVGAGEQFSFNQTVGKRTQENGYMKALVINNGVYTEGVGGGVCQVSSTLYNAWLLSGLDVLFAKAHTLPASYVDLSRDATVSDWIDLVLKNPTEHNIKIKTECKNDIITVSIIGAKSEYEYNLKSEIIKTIEPTEEVFELDEIGQNEYFAGKEGYVSRLVLTITNGNGVVAKREIRRDYYKPQNNIKILRKSGLN